MFLLIDWRSLSDQKCLQIQCFKGPFINHKLTQAKQIRNMREKKLYIGIYNYDDCHTILS